MVNLDLEIRINDYIALSNSVVEVFLNDDLIATLNGQTRKYSNNFILSEQTNRLIIKRKYVAGNIEKCNIFKKLISIILALLLSVLSHIEPFECLCECEEEFNISFNKDTAKMTIDCSQDGEAVCPVFQIDCKECNISSRKRLFVSDEELKGAYNEKKAIIKAAMLFSISVFLAFIIISIIYMNTVTLIFSTVIFSLLLICGLYSFKSLEEQCLNFKSEFNNSVL